MAQASRVKRSFVNRTLQLVRAYHGPDEATNLINCLLGLLLVGESAAFERIPDDPLSSLRSWGLSRKSIRSFGTCQCGGGHPRTLRQLVGALRRAAAHEITPLRSNGTCTGFEFREPSGFHAVLKTAELKRFVEKLARQLDPAGELDSGKTRYVASWQRDPFHLRTCKWANRIRKKNRQGVRTRRQALKAGHRPCKVCKP